MENRRIQVLIPIFNDEDLMEGTLKSIADQDYDPDLIYVSVMDFGNGSANPDRLLKEQGFKHYGFYQDRTITDKRRLPAKMQRILKWVNPGGIHCYSVVLYPGDIIYRDYFSSCNNAMVEHSTDDPYMVVCETDIWGHGGETIHQPRLFEKDTMIDGTTQMDEYVGRAYRHHILTFGYQLSVKKLRESGERNEGRWWNKCARGCFEKNVLYLSRPMGCVRTVSYEDELEEILYRWDSLILFDQFMYSKLGRHISPDYIGAGVKNLAEYALWRSFLLFDVNKRDSEDCLLISCAINKEIAESDQYKAMKKMFKDDCAESRSFLKEFFDTHGWD